MTYNTLQGIFTIVIGFVAWPPQWYKKVAKLLCVNSSHSGHVIAASSWPRDSLS